MILKVHHNQQTYFFEVEKGNLFDILLRKGVFLASDCSGKGICGKCKVKILDGILNCSEEIVDGFAKACKSEVVQDVEIEIYDAVIFLKNSDLNAKINVPVCSGTCDTCSLHCKKN